MDNELKRISAKLMDPETRDEAARELLGHLIQETDLPHKAACDWVTAIHQAVSTGISQEYFMHHMNEIYQFESEFQPYRK